MTITFPSDCKEIIDEIRDTIGREVTFYETVSGSPCPTCTLDPVRNLSSDPFCVTCNGKYWLDTISGWTVVGHVRWYDDYQPLWSEGGIVREGDCKVTITYSDIYLERVKNTDHVEVDGKSLYMKNYRLKGVPTPNRITVNLLEDKG